MIISNTSDKQHRTQLQRIAQRDERRSTSGFEGVDVGHRVRIQLMHTGAEQGYIDFKKVG